MGSWVKKVKPNFLYLFMFRPLFQYQFLFLTQYYTILLVHTHVSVSYQQCVLSWWIFSEFRLYGSQMVETLIESNTKCFKTALKAIILLSPYKDCNFLTENHTTHHESLMSSDFSLLMLFSGVDNEVPVIKAWKSARASFGLCKGTSCPAPLTVTKFRPSYSWVHPPTCLKSCPHIVKKVSKT